VVPAQSRKARSGCPADPANDRGSSSSLSFTERVRTLCEERLRVPARESAPGVHKVSPGGFRLTDPVPLLPPLLSRVSPPPPSISPAYLPAKARGGPASPAGGGGTRTAAPRRGARVHTQPPPHWPLLPFKKGAPVPSAVTPAPSSSTFQLPFKKDVHPCSTPLAHQTRATAKLRGREKPGVHRGPRTSGSRSRCPLAPRGDSPWVTESAFASHPTDG